MNDHNLPHRSSELSELLAGYVLGDLEPSEVARVRDLIAQNPQLQQEVEALQATLSLLPLTLPEVLPTAALRTQILETAQTHTVSNRISTAPKKLPQYRRWAAITGGLAAVLAAGWGLHSYQLSTEIAQTKSQLRQANAELTNYRTAVTMLRQPDSRLMAITGKNLQQTATGNLAIARQSKTAVLTLDRVPSLPNGQVYRMWAFVNGKKVTCTDFVPDKKGQVLLQLPDDKWGETTTAIVTVEPEQQLPNPTGEMVMNGGKPIEL
jgi:anti-sigma-K factor RskA